MTNSRESFVKKLLDRNQESGDSTPERRSVERSNERLNNISEEPEKRSKFGTTKNSVKKSINS